jgi:general secretion pathway protein G
MRSSNQFGRRVRLYGAGENLRRHTFDSRNRIECSRGFTLLELLVVISIIAIFMTVAIPMYNQSILRARERALRSDLDLLNEKIEQYTLDKKKAPQSLDDLKNAGYMEQIPNDPMTGEPNWEVEQDQFLLSFQQEEPGITGVHSASSALSSNGEAYSTW